jgi:hypothetical protein
VSRIWADGVDRDKRTIGPWAQSLSMSREAVPNWNQCNRVGTDHLGHLDLRGRSGSIAGA